MYRCNYCGKEFNSRIPHRCKGGFRKHKLSFTIVPNIIKYSLDSIKECKYRKDIVIGSNECKKCSYNLETTDSKVICANNIGSDLNVKSCPDKYNNFPSKSLIKLLQLRDFYNKSWIPDWNTNDIKYCIKNVSNKVIPDITVSESKILTFKDEVTRDLFLNHYKNLIDKMKDFI